MHHGTPVFQASQRPVHDDERPVRQLRGPEDDWRGGAAAEKDAHVQDPTAHGHAAQVHVRQAHPGQAGEVLHEGLPRAAEHGHDSQRSAAVAPQGGGVLHEGLAVAAEHGRTASRRSAAVV